MSIKMQTCHTVACDDCKTDWEHDYTPHWPSGGEAIDDAIGAGDWWGDENLLLCDNCKVKPHAYTPDEIFDDCGRCDLPEEEHDEIPAVTGGPS